LFLIGGGQNIIKEIFTAAKEEDIPGTHT